MNMRAIAATLLASLAAAAQTQLTSTFLTLPAASIPSSQPGLLPLPEIPTLSIAQPPSSSVESNAQPPSSSVESNAQPPSSSVEPPPATVGFIPLVQSDFITVPSPSPVNTLVAAPAPMISWAVLPEGVPRTKSGKPIPCSPKNTKLNPATHKLISECVETTFCSAPPGAPPNATGLGVCLPRLCRRDEYPFGYGLYGGGSGGTTAKKTNGKKGQSTNTTTVILPPMCGVGSFCPDDGSGCRPRVSIGSICELDRDEQCDPPPPNPDIPASENKAVCLNLQCTAATLPLNASCTIENTTYVGDVNRGVAGGGQFTTVVIKHNCLSPGLFCDPAPLNVDQTGPTCQPTKKVGQKCRFDAECELLNCLSSSKKCALPSQTPLHIASWHWAATVLFIVVSMGALFLILTVVNKRRRFEHYQQLQSYYIEQINLRRSILALHAAAAEQKIVNGKESREKTG